MPRRRPGRPGRERGSVTARESRAGLVDLDNEVFGRRIDDVDHLVPLDGVGQGCDKGECPKHGAGSGQDGMTRSMRTMAMATGAM
jgi:hypothetical protein